MKLHLVDIDGDLVATWEKSFKSFPEVAIECGDILSVAETCVVSPANSYGFMDGGIDLVYRQFFGQQIERRVQEAVTSRPEGHLPVGASLIVPTGHERIPYLIVAPTMVTPEPVPPEHSYRAMRAALRVAAAHPEIRNVYCPGLATGVGMVTPQNGAAMMAEAYRNWKREQEILTGSKQKFERP